MNPRIQIATAQPAMQRKIRTPRHAFYVEHKPWVIQPTMIAPVLAGETLSSLLWQKRVVSDPLKSKLTGWWVEDYFFYVKHTDLQNRDLLQMMHLAQGTDMAPMRGGATVRNEWYYGAGAGGINWLKFCTDEVVRWYFRDENEPLEPKLGAGADGGSHLASINNDGWWQSGKLAAQIPGDTINSSELPGENPVIPDGVPTGFENHFLQWEQMVAIGLTDATFEDYLKSFGVTVAKNNDEELRRPELLRYYRSFEFPSNSVVPETGAVSSALSAVTQQRADKDRFFAEPGFIVGYQVVRPKVYLANLKAPLVNYMDNAYRWLPAILMDQPYTSLIEFAAANGANPSGGVVNAADGWWVDLRDLFMHGDQLVSLGTGTAHKTDVALPSAADGRSRFPTAAECDAPFLGAATARWLRTDGVISLSIKSRIRDTSL